MMTGSTSAVRIPPVVIQDKNLADDTLTELLSIESAQRYSELTSKTPVNAYILLGLKILNQESVPLAKRESIRKHLENINFFLFEDLKKNGIYAIDTFKASEDFSKFMFQEVFT
jgi:hypothetical protein